MEQTLVLVKPDGVQRGLVGRITQRFEEAGLKIVGIKMQHIDAEFAAKHYFDVEERHGAKIFNMTSDYITSGPVAAMVLEGVEAVANVRRLVGPTEPKSAAPGTIRGDFAHMSYARSDAIEKSVRNLVHASGAVDEAEHEIKLWFSADELHSYDNDYQKHTF